MNVLLGGGAGWPAEAAVIGLSAVRPGPGAGRLPVAEGRVR